MYLFKTFELRSATCTLKRVTLKSKQKRIYYKLLQTVIEFDAYYGVLIFFNIDFSSSISFLFGSNWRLSDVSEVIPTTLPYQFQTFTNILQILW